VAAELIVTAIVGSFAKLGKHMESIYDILASVDKLGSLFDLPTEAHDKLFHLQDGEPAAVSVRDVTFRFGSETVLRELNLDLQPGECVALAGPAEAGKTMLIDLLCGLRAPTSGHIELDGIDLRELRPDSFRESLGVCRSIEIFHGSINETVHLHRPQISAGDVREALEAVGLLDELLKLPEGLNTVLQSHGRPLTTSQASRLMVARAIVSHPRLLLIDGTLDAMPDDAGAAVLARLTEDRVPWTLLVATGRQAIALACGRSERLGAET
jgi:ABC-type bacteriocin/lantibiotic exporter with double-glycine peptidase domain